MEGNRVARARLPFFCLWHGERHRFEEASVVTAVVMVGELGQGTDPVNWVRGARQAAACDLMAQLRRQPLVQKVVLVAPNAVALAPDGVIPVASPAGPVHVGAFLAELTATFGIERLLYFGGGSAPLLSEAELGELVAQLAAAERLVTTNNQFSSDWAGIVPASILPQYAPRLPRDNMLGWVLSTEAGLPLAVLPVSAASRLDIDTPTDLLALRLCRHTQPHLHRYLSQLPLDTTDLQQAIDILATPARRVFIAGRISPEVWQSLNRVSRCWLRVLAEERGMVSSGRRARGEVYSLLAEQMSLVGLPTFFTRLADWADLAFIDTRVLWTSLGHDPAAADRFASDLGLWQQIAHPWVAEMTRAAQASAVPVILGGHSLMAGDMLALCDLVAARHGAAA